MINSWNYLNKCCWFNDWNEGYDVLLIYVRKGKSVISCFDLWYFFLILRDLVKIKINVFVWYKLY